MKRNLLTAAVIAGIAMNAQAAPRDQQNRPRIEPVMRLQPVAGASDAYELLIYGDIGDSWRGESVTAQSVAQQLNDLDATVATLNVRINSYGGSVADGLAVYNALKRHKATKAVTVDGVAMSSASLIAMAGDTVTMPATSVLMIHAPWGGIMGNAKELRQYADVLDTFSKSMVSAYTAKSGMDEAEALALLTDGEDHYYTGDEAVAAGFADAVEDLTADESSHASATDARAFADSLLDRIAAKAPAKYAGLAIAAALRGAGTVGTKPAAPLAPTASAPPIQNTPDPSERNPSAAVVDIPTGDIPVTEEEKKALAKQAVAADKARREAIRAQFAPFAARRDGAVELATLQSQCEDDADITPEAAGQRLLAHLGKDSAPIAGNHRIEAGGMDETVTYREGAQAALLHRYNPSAHKVDEKSKGFRGMDLLGLASDTLIRSGKSTRGMSKHEIAVQAMQTTSDFPNILENVVGKTLRAGYEGTMRTFLPFSRQAILPDFKQISRAQLGGAPSLKRVLEGAEYEHGIIGEGAAKYAVQKYGRIVSLSWETIVNDDLDAMTRIPFAFGASAADLESDLVYAILTGNAAMADTFALFSSQHANLGTAAKLADALDPTKANPLAEMRQMMLLQKGIEGRYITVRPQFLIVPPELEEVALKATNASIIAGKGVDLNVTGVSLTPIVEPRLHDGSATAWYGAAAPGTIDTIEYAYLEGHEGVFTETKSGFEVDGVQIKCRHVFGAAPIDFRGLYKNAGLA